MAQDGIVHLAGAIANGASATVFTLPSELRPATNAYVGIDLCNAAHGRLAIAPSGVVTVDAQGGSLAGAACFTSLDGASFARL